MYIQAIHTIPNLNSNPFNNDNDKYDAAFPQRVANVMNPLQRDRERKSTRYLSLAVVTLYFPLLVTVCSSTISRKLHSFYSLPCCCSQIVQSSRDLSKSSISSARLSKAP